MPRMAVAALAICAAVACERQRGTFDYAGLDGVADAIGDREADLLKLETNLEELSKATPGSARRTALAQLKGAGRPLDIKRLALAPLHALPPDTANAVYEYGGASEALAHELDAIADAGSADPQCADSDVSIQTSDAGVTIVGVATPDTESGRSKLRFESGVCSAICLPNEVVVARARSAISLLKGTDKPGLIAAGRTVQDQLRKFSSAR